jgi:hypothetical protein
VQDNGRLIGGQDPQAGELEAGCLLKADLNGLGKRAVGKRAAVGVPLPDRVEQFALGARRRPGRLGRDDGDEERRVRRVRKRPDQRVMAGQPDRHPDVEQRGTAAQVQGSGVRIGHPERTIWVGIDLDQIVLADAEPPRLRVVNRWCRCCGLDDPAHGLVVS